MIYKNNTWAVIKPPELTRREGTKYGKIYVHLCGSD